MELSIIDKIFTFLQTIFSSFLTIELLIVFVVIYLFLHFNHKINNKKIKFLICGLILFIVCICFFLFQQDIGYVFSSIVKVIMQCFYFPNIIFYFATVLLSFICLCWTVFASYPKNRKIIQYILLLTHLYLFTVFATICYQEELSLINTANIYQYDSLFVIGQVSQCIFILFWIYQLSYRLYKRFHRPVEKKWWECYNG